MEYISIQLRAPTGLSPSVADTWVKKNWLLLNWVNATSHESAMNTGEKSLRMMFTVTKAFLTALRGETGSASRNDTSNWKIPKLEYKNDQMVKTSDL